MGAAPPVSIQTQVTGPATSTWANSVKTITDALNQPAGFEAYQASTVTSIGSSGTVWTPIGWADSAGIVLDNQSGHSTSTNNTRWTCPAGWAGWYWVYGTVYWTGATSSTRFVAVQVNGTVLNGSPAAFATPPVTGNFSMSAGLKVFLNAGDYVELAARQASGSSIATQIGLPFTSSILVEYRGAA